MMTYSSGLWVLEEEVTAHHYMAMRPGDVPSVGLVTCHACPQNIQAVDSHCSEARCACCPTGFCALLSFLSCPTTLYTWFSCSLKVSSLICSHARGPQWLFSSACVCFLDYPMDSSLFILKREVPNTEAREHFLSSPSFLQSDPPYTLFIYLFHVTLPLPPLHACEPRSYQLCILKSFSLPVYSRTRFISYWWMWALFEVNTFYFLTLSSWSVAMLSPNHGLNACVPLTLPCLFCFFLSPKWGRVPIACLKSLLLSASTHVNLLLNLQVSGM